jgi:hypothetical protein
MDYSGLTLVLREAEMSESLLPGLEPPVQRPSAEDLPAAAHFPIGAIMKRPHLKLQTIITGLLVVS